MSDSYGQNLNASLVQLVERRSPKPDVEGSSPSRRVPSQLCVAQRVMRPRVILKAWALLRLLVIIRFSRVIAIVKQGYPKGFSSFFKWGSPAPVPSTEVPSAQPSCDRDNGLACQRTTSPLRKKTRSKKRIL